MFFPKLAPVSLCSTLQESESSETGKAEEARAGDLKVAGAGFRA